MLSEVRYLPVRMERDLPLTRSIHVEIIIVEENVFTFDFNPDILQKAFRRYHHGISIVVPDQPCAYAGFREPEIFRLYKIQPVFARLPAGCPQMGEQIR